MKSTHKQTKPRIGVLYATTQNLGDMIQAHAQIKALELCGIKDYVMVDRDRLPQYSGEPVYLIMGGWFTETDREKHFPLSKQITPIYTSFHASTENLVKKHHKHFAIYAPIGCRDEHTMRCFHKHGIDAYLTKCLSLSFDTYHGPRYGTYNVDALWNEYFRSFETMPIHKSMPAYTSMPKCIYLGHGVECLRDNTLPSLSRYNAMTAKFLGIYKTASLIITSRLHCALPCRAFGTPVIFVHKQYKDERRFTGFHEILNGSDGHTPFEMLSPHVEDKIIEQSRKAVLSDLRSRLSALGLLD